MPLDPTAAIPYTGVSRSTDMAARGEVDCAAFNRVTRRTFNVVYDRLSNGINNAVWSSLVQRSRNAITDVVLDDSLLRTIPHELPSNR